MDHVPGRVYVKERHPKGKAKTSEVYRRETRDVDGVPESRKQILQFLKEKNKELKHFIQETTETEDITREVSLDHPRSEIFDDTGEMKEAFYLDDEIYNSEEELLENEEF